MITIVVRDESQAANFALKHLPRVSCLFTSDKGKRLAVWLINSAGFGELYTQVSVKRQRRPHVISARVLQSCLGSAEGILLWK